MYMISQHIFIYVYDEQTYLPTHFKKFGPSKTLTAFKYATKISGPLLPVWDTTILCA